MATMTVQNIVDRAGIILQDTTHIRWDSTELLKWLNDAQREIVMRKPDAYVTSASLALVEGTRQSLPATGVQLIDVSRNLGPTDTPADGPAVTYMPRKILDNSKRSWHTETAAAVIQHFCFDERDPKKFYVYPPADATSSVEIIFAAAPADILISDTITLDDIFANAILDYILYRAYSKDADYTANSPRAQAAYQSFLNSLGLRDEAEAKYDPNNHPSIAETNVTQLGK